MKNCKHQNIIITIKQKYNIPCGYLKEIEKENCDLGKYFIEQEEEHVFCEDCGEYY